MRRKAAWMLTAASVFAAVLGGSVWAEGTTHLIGIADEGAMRKQAEEVPAKQDLGKQEAQGSDGTVQMSGWKVAIDPGHQGSWVDMSELEPSAPGSSEMKAKATTGTTGKFSGVNEYELNLDVSLLLKEELLERGYEVVMTRENHDTAISNKERAELAASEGADVLVRIHANGSEDTSVNGALAMVPSQENPYVGSLYSECYDLGEDILTAYCASTGIADLGVQYYDNMSGINWSTIPVTILEMGFMSNQNDDLLMTDHAFQVVMAEGIADGIDAYFADKEPEKAQSEAAGTLNETAEGDADAQSGKDTADAEKAPAGAGADAADVSEEMMRVENELAENLAVRAGVGETWAAAVVNLNTGESCVVNDQPMQAASLIKLFIMGAVMDQYETLTEIYGQDQIQALLSDMITVSDNSAANALTNYLGEGDDAAGRTAVNAYCAANGYEQTTMGRMLLAPADQGDNITSVSDCSTFLTKVYQGDVPYAEEMMGYLKNQQRTHKIPAGLPEGVESANKTGELDTVENDAAVIFAEKPYILCIMSANLGDVGQAQYTISELSSDVYQMMEETA